MYQTQFFAVGELCRVECTEVCGGVNGLRSQAMDTNTFQKESDTVMNFSPAYKY